MWGNLQQEPINKAVKNFSKHLKACVGARSWQWVSEHSWWQWNSGIWSH